MDYEDTSVSLFLDGVAPRVGVRFSEHWGASLDGVVPLCVSGKSPLVSGWFASSPITVLSAAYYF